LRLDDQTGLIAATSALAAGRDHAVASVGTRGRSCDVMEHSARWRRFGNAACGAIHSSKFCDFAGQVNLFLLLIALRRAI